MSKWYLKCSYNARRVSVCNTGGVKSICYFILFFTSYYDTIDIGSCAHPPVLERSQLPTQHPLLNHVDGGGLPAYEAHKHSHSTVIAMQHNVLPHPNGCNAQDRPLLAGKKPTITMRRSGGGRGGRGSTIVFAEAWCLYFFYVQTVSPPVMWLMCNVCFHMIPRNFASRRSYGEQHICVYCCGLRESNGEIIRAIVCVLTG
jgi:hypothetical protein